MAATFNWFTLDPGMISDPPLNLYRIYKDDEHMLLQRWRPSTNRWFDTPGLSAVSGIGGVDHYLEIDQAEARAIMVTLGGEKLASDNLVAGLEETLWPGESSRLEETP